MPPYACFWNACIFLEMPNDLLQWPTLVKMYVYYNLVEATRAA